MKYNLLIGTSAEINMGEGERVIAYSDAKPDDAGKFDLENTQIDVDASMVVISTRVGTWPSEHYDRRYIPWHRVYDLTVTRDIPR